MDNQGKAPKLTPADGDVDDGEKKRRREERKKEEKNLKKQARKMDPKA